MEVSEAEKTKYINQAKTIDTEFIENSLEILNQFEINYKQSSNHKIHTEIALIKICSLNKKKTPKSEEVKKITEVKEKDETVKATKTDKSKLTNKDIVEADNSVNKDTPNLKNLLTEKKESEAKKKDKEESNEKIPFTEDEYKILINDFSESLKEKKSEVAILKKRTSIEGTEITFHLDNELEGTIFDSIINRLKEKLKNRFEEKIILKKEINETEKEKTIYTNKDKFEYLSKKNTNLSDLKNKLGLDYEF